MYLKYTDISIQLGSTTEEIWIFQVDSEKITSFHKYFYLIIISNNMLGHKFLIRINIRNEYIAIILVFFICQPVSYALKPKDH